MLIIPYFPLNVFVLSISGYGDHLLREGWVCKRSYAGLKHTLVTFDFLFALCKELRYLWILDLSHNMISHLKPGIFRTLEHLYHLDLSRNLITNVTKATFRGLKRLRDLYLNRNRITILYRFMFYRLKNLLKLHLQDNPISQWGNDTFQCANCFEKWYVNLSGTQILDSLRRGTHVFNPHK